MVQREKALVTEDLQTVSNLWNETCAKFAADKESLSLKAAVVKLGQLRVELKKRLTLCNKNLLISCIQNIVSIVLLRTLYSLPSIYN
jgi:hypothetical protein